MQFDVSNKIVISNFTKEVLQWCRENLILDNPDYFKKKRMGKWTGNTPEKIYLYEKVGTTLYLPFGVINKLWKMFPDANLYTAHFKAIQTVKYDSLIKLYSYQETAVRKAVKAKNGIIVMPCGSGKTQTALQLVAELGGKCLWLTHTQDLLNQSMSRAKSVYDIETATFGMITDGKVNIGESITFATVQTLSKIDLSHLKNEWDIIIVDECQHCCGGPTRVTQFYKVLSCLSARYKVGLTATPKRSDGLHKSMFALLGDIIHEVSREEVAHTTCPVKINRFQTGYIPDPDIVLCGDGTINYTSLIEDLIQNKERFNFVSNIINLQYKAGAMLVLGNRVEYLERLNKNFEGKSVCLSGMGNSKKAKAERKEVLFKLNSGDLDCVFATYQLAKEGLDVPNLRFVVFATPEKDETTVIQAVGRVGRKAEGKQYGTVIDFEDNFGMYHGWAKKRRSYYKKIGASIYIQ